MSRRMWGMAGIVALTVLSGAAAWGGWAVVTVENPPDYLVAGKPLDLTFTVRQHGFTMMTGISPSIEARSGSQRVTARTTALRDAGWYRATLTVPTTGDWQIIIHSGWGRSDNELLPMQAIAAGAQPPAVPAPYERGRRLFAAKGCTGCHVHNSVDVVRGVDVGPDLTQARFPAEYLREFLANPDVKTNWRSPARMPKLGLKPMEIASLISFINAERVQTANR